MARCMMLRHACPGLAVLLIGTAITGAHAQDATTVHKERTKAVRTVSAPNPPTTYRGLTINRPPDAGLDDGSDDIYRDGPTRYNDVRDFSPSPYTTSGVEYPYGLDGIGGYGSELGFSAGQDAALYNRGAGLP